MKILLVGKTGVFETLAVAYGYLQMNWQECSYMGDLGLENQKGLIKVGTNSDGTEIYVLGFNVPQIVAAIKNEIEHLSDIKEEKRLLVVPLTIERETFSWVLSKLANIPLIGDFFLRWAQSRTERRAPYLLELGRNLNLAHNPADNNNLIYAAKPRKN